MDLFYSSISSENAKGNEKASINFIFSELSNSAGQCVSALSRLVHLLLNSIQILLYNTSGKVLSTWMGNKKIIKNISPTETIVTGLNVVNLLPFYFIQGTSPL